ncbi:MAG: TlpA disulfide reductase family protein [Bacteroidota bacterium]|nr:TlpA disulfide reductase family protein [Bacteroidota bacterium]
MDTFDPNSTISRFPSRRGLLAAIVLLVTLLAPLPGTQRPLMAQQLPPASSMLERDGTAIPIYEGFETLAPLFHARGDTTVIVNFWATWCAPCVEELPYFEELTRDRGDAPYQVILVSLDFRTQLERRLLPFVRERNIRSTVVVLDDADANAWIDRIDPAWSGAIPATLVFNAQRREFREQTFTREELFSLIDSFVGEKK